MGGPDKKLCWVRPPSRPYITTERSRFKEAAGTARGREGRASGIGGAEPMAEFVMGEDETRKRQLGSQRPIGRTDKKMFFVRTHPKPDIATERSGFKDATATARGGAGRASGIGDKESMASFVMAENEMRMRQLGYSLEAMKVLSSRLATYHLDLERLNRRSCDLLNMLDRMKLSEDNGPPLGAVSGALPVSTSTPERSAPPPAVPPYWDSSSDSEFSD